MVKLTAGIHRQTWISGYPVFIDIHIENRSSKDVKRIELQLEKKTLFHDYSAPSAGVHSTDGLRVPNYMQKEIISRTHMDGFQGVRGLSQDLRTCQMELPTGLVSIETGVSCHFHSNAYGIFVPLDVSHSAGFTLSRSLWSFSKPLPRSCKILNSLRDIYLCAFARIHFSNHMLCVAGVGNEFGGKANGAGFRFNQEMLIFAFVTDSIL